MVPYWLMRLPLVAAVFANVLAREQATQALETAHTEVQRLKDQLALENVQLAARPVASRSPYVLTAESPAAQYVLSQIEQVAPTTATVLLSGETGSGKEVSAEALHDLSPRRREAHGADQLRRHPDDALESELFGRERGAYTGALSRQAGAFRGRRRVAPSSSTKSASCRSTSR